MHTGVNVSTSHLSMLNTGPWLASKLLGLVKYVICLQACLLKSDFKREKNTTFDCENGLVVSNSAHTVHHSTQHKFVQIISSFTDRFHYIHLNMALNWHWLSMSGIEVTGVQCEQGVGGQFVSKSNIYLRNVVHTSQVWCVLLSRCVETERRAVDMVYSVDLLTIKTNWWGRTSFLKHFIRTEISTTVSRLD